MSLLEDIFLQDEANEAQELERVIEDDEYDERPRSAMSNSDENSAKEDEAEEDKRRVDPASNKPKKIIKNPRFVLNPARLTGPRGIQVIPDHFKDFKFKGKGHEKEDLDLVLKKLEHWAYRLYPKFGFEDCLKKIETLGKKKPVMVHLHKIRSDQFQSAETVVQKDSSDEEDAPPVEEDEFDRLLQQQIELARATPAPDSVRKPGAATPRHINMSPFAMPKATSSPSISDEQRERMLRNRKLAEEKRLARLKQNTSNENPPEVETVRLSTLQERISNADCNSESSDEESSVTLVNQSVTVEINAISDREFEIEKHSNNENEVIHDVIIEQHTHSTELDTGIKQTKITIVDDVELSETYTEQQDIEEFTNDNGKMQNRDLNEIHIGEVNFEENVAELSETYTEQQEMEVESNVPVKEKGRELNTECITKVISTNAVAQEKEPSNTTEVTIDNEVENVVENCVGNESRDSIISKEEVIIQTAHEDNIEESNNSISHVTAVDNEEKSEDVKKCNNFDVTVHNNHVEIDKMVDEDLMDVDFDDDF